LTKHLNPEETAIVQNVFNQADAFEMQAYAEAQMQAQAAQQGQAHLPTQEQAHTPVQGQHPEALQVQLEHAGQSHTNGHSPISATAGADASNVLPHA
jgi:hypothetical protein